MVKVLIGDILKSKAHTLVNTVNTVGVMGKGIALQFKQAFPDMYKDYVRRCRAGEVRLGRPYLFERASTPWIILFPTKEHWRSTASLDAIVEGLNYMIDHYRKWGIKSIAVPPLGCGEGQLEWAVVGPTLYRHLELLSIPVELYAPFDTPAHQLTPGYLRRAVTAADLSRIAGRPRRLEPALIALVEILGRIEARPYHWPVGRTTFQKIAYFATQLGIPTGLEYQAGSFGPYAPGLKRLTARLMNNGLIREEMRGSMFHVRVGQTFKDAREVKVYKESLEAWEGPIERISNLFSRLSTKEAELAATVHFAAERVRKTARRKPSELEVLAEVLGWKRRRKPALSTSEIAETIRSLAMLGWLDVESSPELPVKEEVLVGV